MRHAIAVVIAGIISLWSYESVRAKEITESYCKDSKTLARMFDLLQREFKEPPRPAQVHKIEFAYRDTYRKPYFCAYYVWSSLGNGSNLYGAIPQGWRNGEMKYKFNHLH